MKIRVSAKAENSRMVSLFCCWEELFNRENLDTASDMIDEEPESYRPSKIREHVKGLLLFSLAKLSQ